MFGFIGLVYRLRQYQYRTQLSRVSNTFFKSRLKLEMSYYSDKIGVESSCQSLHIRLVYHKEVFCRMIECYVTKLPMWCRCKQLPKFRLAKRRKEWKEMLTRRTTRMHFFPFHPRPFRTLGRITSRTQFAMGSLEIREKSCHSGQSLQSKHVQMAIKRPIFVQCDCRFLEQPEVKLLNCPLVPIYCIKADIIAIA